jgi:hypothetical protein
LAAERDRASKANVIRSEIRSRAELNCALPASVSAPFTPNEIPRTDTLVQGRLRARRGFGYWGEQIGFPHQRGSCQPQDDQACTARASARPTASMVPATNIFMTNSLAACPPTQALGLLVFERCPWRLPEADGHPVIGIHQADRDREIDQLLLLKSCARGLECCIRHAGP